MSIQPIEMHSKNSRWGAIASWSIVLSFWSIGCATSAASTPKTSAPPTTASAPIGVLPLTQSPESAPARVNKSIGRSVIRQWLAAGLGAVLEHVTFDDHPVMSMGKFHGFRVTGVDMDLWPDLDVRPSDVLTRVNGKIIESPEDAVRVFQGLEFASELRIEYERDGVPLEQKFLIVDDEEFHPPPIVEKPARPRIPPIPPTKKRTTKPKTH